MTSLNPHSGLHIFFNWLGSHPNWLPSSVSKIWKKKKKKMLIFIYLSILLCCFFVQIFGILGLKIILACTLYFQLTSKQKYHGLNRAQGFFVMSICDRLWYERFNIFGFLKKSNQNLENAIFRKSLAFQLSVLERLDNFNVSQIGCFGSTWEKNHPVY